MSAKVAKSAIIDASTDDDMPTFVKAVKTNDAVEKKQTKKVISSDSEDETKSTKPVEKKQSKSKKIELTDSEAETSKKSSKKSAKKSTSDTEEDKKSSKKSTDDSSDEEETEEKPNEVIAQLENIHKSIEVYQINLTNMKKTIKDLMGICKKKLKDRKPRIEKEYPISAELAKLLKKDTDGKYKKSNLTSEVITYLKEQGLQCEDNKKEFKPNDKMKKIFGMTEERYTLIQVSKFVSQHLKKD